MLFLVNRGANIAFLIHRRRLECLFLLGIFVAIVAAETPGSPEYYQTGQGWSCQMCPRGTFVNSPCTSDDPTSTDCRNCTPGKFQPNAWTNENRCYNCDECDPGLDGSLGGEPLEACTIFENAVCRCAEGLYWSQVNRRCTSVTKCPPGQGVTHPATIVADTECEPCREEAFSAASSAEETCAPCLICEEWQQEVSDCNRTHDRVCQNVSMATGIPPTVKHPQEVSDKEGSQLDNTAAIVAPVVLGGVVVLVALAVGVFFYRRSKNARQQNDPEGPIPRDNQGLLNGSSSSTNTSSRSSSTSSGRGSPTGTSISTRSPDSLQYQSEPDKPCAATPFGDGGAVGPIDDVDGPGRLKGTLCSILVISKQMLG
ncbi:tumor necrosis factor receptor superfamily member 5-like [Branchiostoma lanceolatum]|uniref:tumor necrosis factor receptor superfamily member 5-like n=1 Tax=Branchiostoma lanceolatum TaxID=7740 RepID=UPI00345440FC